MKGGVPREEVSGSRSHIVLPVSRRLGCSFLTASASPRCHKSGDRPRKRSHPSNPSSLSLCQPPQREEGLFRWLSRHELIFNYIYALFLSRIVSAPWQSPTMRTLQGAGCLGLVSITGLLQRLAMKILAPCFPWVSARPGWPEDRSCLVSRGPRRDTTPEVSPPLAGVINFQPMTLDSTRAGQ